MEQIEIFQVLEIEPTKDENLIKNAYRQKLAITNPEDNPEGFKRLRTAFEEACRLARQPEETEESRETDTSPSGLWVEKAAGIYGNIENRQSVEQWKELFEEDIFLSLEEEENCRLKFLRFLMDHYKLPTEVWKLLDGKLNIVQDAARLREHFPVDFISFIVNRCERGEDVDFGQFEGAPDAPYDLFLQYYEQCYRALEAGEEEKAAEYLKNADDLHIFHPVIEICRAGLREKQGRAQEAVSLLKEMKDRFPKDTMVCYNCAEFMWRNGQKEEAAAAYEELKEENDSHYMANVRLTEWYYEQKRYQDAKKCAEKVISLGSDDQFMELLKKVNYEIEKELEKKYRSEHDLETALELGWCYLQDGKNHAGIRLAVEIEKQITPNKEAEYDGLLAKLYVEGAEYEDSIYMTEHWEAALQTKIAGDESEEEKEKDRDRLRQAHLIRMQCYRSLGYKESSCFQKAIQEAESIETGTSKDIGLLLEKAQIYLEMEEYEKSLEVSRRLIEEYQIYAAYASSMEAYARQWDASGVMRDGRACINYFPTFVRAYERVAKVYLDLQHTEELKQLLEEAKQNGVQSPILEAYRYQMDHKVPETKELDKKIAEFRKNFLQLVENGETQYYETGLPIVTEYLYWYPGSYMLVERGIFHKAAHHLEEAVADYEKALAVSPNNPYALNGLSFVYRYRGDYEKALVYLKKAILYKEDDMNYIYADLAGLYSLLGDYKSALTAYKIFVEKNGKDNLSQMRKMAMCLANCGYIDGAVDKFKEINGDDLYSLYNDLTELYQCAGLAKEAEKVLTDWENKLRAESSFLERIFHLNPNKDDPKADIFKDFYEYKAFQELLYGDGKKAIEYFDKLFRQEGPGENAGRLAAAIIACILLEKPKKGKKYTALLKRWIRQDRETKKNTYYNGQKRQLMLDFLAAYYDETQETLSKILEKEKNCEICHHCTFAVCREMETVQILYLLRIGKKEEAMDRLRRDLEKQPMDEYLIAIRNRIPKMKSF